MARSKKCPGSLEKRSGHWRWRVSVGGTPYSFTIHTADRKEAEQWARAKYEQLDRTQARREDGLPVGKLFSELCDYYERERLPRLAPGTQGTYLGSLKTLRLYSNQHWRTLPLERIRPSHIVQFLDWRKVHRLTKHAEEPTVTQRTVAKDRAVLHRLFEVAEELEWREGNPVARTKVEPGDAHQYVILDEDQYETLLRECHGPMVGLYLLFCGETGARCKSEVLWVRWEDVDFEKGVVKIVSGRGGHRTKGGKTRYVPLTPRLVAALKAHFAQFRFAAYDRPDLESGTIRPAFLFHHTGTLRHAKAGARITGMHRAVTNAATRAKLPDEWRLHDLRHRRITTWLAEGKSPALVQKAVGHADIRTTMLYTHLVTEDLKALVEPAPKTQGTDGQIVGKTAEK